MERVDIDEIHYIAHVDSVPSIMKHGILCRYRVGLRTDIQLEEIADPGIVTRRADRKVADGGSLDKYVNLFFNPRNAMLYRLCREYDPASLAILSIDPSVLDLPGVVITKINAVADDDLRSYNVAESLARLSFDEIFIDK